MNKPGSEDDIVNIKTSAQQPVFRSPYKTGTRLHAASMFAAAAHASVDQKRSYTGEDYIFHPAEVAGIVSRVTDDEDTIIAAWLHDVDEDTDVTNEEIKAKFGDNVASMVFDLTDCGLEFGVRKVRKEIDCNRLAAASANVQNIKLADTISNTSSIVEHDKNFAVTYIKEKIVLLSMLEKGHPLLHEQAKESVYAAAAELGISTEDLTERKAPKHG